MFPSILLDRVVGEEGLSPRAYHRGGNYDIMLLFAHRGWSARHSENSCAAFRAAAGQRIAGCECDVRLTSDGAVVVCHDADLRRWGGSRRPLAQRTLAEVQADGLPRLEEVLDILQHQTLLVEIKPHGGPAHTEALVRRTVAIISHAQAEERAALLCFQVGPLALAARLAPGLRRVRNVEGIPNDPRWADAQRSCWAVDGDHTRLEAPAVDLLRERGVQVFAYTVNTRRDAERCRRLGLSGIISNHADLWS